MLSDHVPDDAEDVILRLRLDAQKKTCACACACSCCGR